MNSYPPLNPLATTCIREAAEEVRDVTSLKALGLVLDKTRKQLDAARNSIDSAGVRTRAIERKLRDVESLSGEASQQLLGDASALDEGGEDDLEI